MRKAPVNILLFTNSLAGGGAERVAATLANWWARRDWTVTIVTLDPQAADFYPLDPRVRRIALDLGGESRNVFEALRHNIRRVSALRRTVRAVRPQVALAMMSTPNVLLALACRGLPGVCTVGSERCYPPHAPLGRLWTALRRAMYGRLDAVVALSGESAAWIREHTSARRVPVIPNPATWPLPDNPPRILQESVCAPGRKVLLAVGRLDPVKDFGALVEAFGQVAGDHPHWDLVILGEGPERERLASAIGAHGLQNRIFLPGIAGNVGHWYGRADLYVLTSRSEGFPNALAEALSHGLPAVSVDCNTGPRDIIRDGVDGLLVPPDDRAALAAALDRLMGDVMLRQQFAARAGEARARFSIEKVALMWEALFTELRGAQSPDAGSRARLAQRCDP